ncbi:phosphatidylinositol-3,5-bisphosphate 3-phosphatase MTMR14-like [Tubulanus polymorphus]|uniref:phosphatidylinositol-3,5-bisphosphate 3-phosphatase MTMR14-like n=1 Tax=Tubulanus polymorphus TaxID=672921 RepID=UPI003DA2B1DB
MSEFPELVRVDDLRNLIEHSSKTIYKPRENDLNAEKIQKHCLQLFGKDYKYTVVDNANGELCSHYPGQIVLLEYSLSTANKHNENVQSLYDVNKLKDLFIKSRFARCRARFAVPIILIEGKHICRSATISGGAEIYGRSGFDFFFSGGESIPADMETVASNTDWQLFDRIRGQDIKLLRTLQVDYICDLMVEKKKVKFGMNVTSSEKVDKEHRYSDFTIVSLPFPGCEFFKEWRENGYTAEGLIFDWNQAFVDAHLDIPTDSISSKMKLDWNSYKLWDLVKLTQSYLKLMLQYISEGEHGMLIHCISGWDRTPLFVSLVRLSLWADGLIHTSLSALEILYLTIAYDWFFFGHNLPDRLSKGEEIFFFCFYFLRYITSDEFSLPKKKTRSVSRTDSENVIDGVLLETDNRSSGYRGSNTSISSSSSVQSNRSNNTELVNVTNLSQDDEPFVCHHTNGSHGGCHRRSPIHRKNSGTQQAEPLSRFGSHLTSSTPMAVPRRAVEQSKSGSSAGSWQIITGTGSLRGTASCTYDSPQSSTSEQSSSSSRNNSCCEIPEEDTIRKEKLDSVRRNFNSIYSTTIGFRNGIDAGRISGLLDQFAEKVGFRKSSLV